MSRDGHGRFAFLVVPENFIKTRCSGGIGTRKIHPGRFIRPLRVPPVNLIDEAIL